MVRCAAALALTCAVVSCVPFASEPVTRSPNASAQTTAARSPVPTFPARLRPTDAPLPAVAGPLLLYQVPGETKVRAISFDGEVQGVVPGEVPPRAPWSQSPYGAPYIVGVDAYDREGKLLGAIPWPPYTNPTWSSDGRFLCAVFPEGTQVRLETAFIGQQAKLVASGFTAYEADASYQVLACDETTDRIIVSVGFLHGSGERRAWIFRLSTGALIRSVKYDGFVISNQNGTLIAESCCAPGPYKATIRKADDGLVVGTVDGLAVGGFSGDGSLVVAFDPFPKMEAAVIDWRTGRRVWRATGQAYHNYLTEPAGRRVAVVFSYMDGSDTSEVYLVNPDGSAVLLPSRVRVARH